MLEGICSSASQLHLLSEQSVNKKLLSCSKINYNLHSRTELLFILLVLTLMKKKLVYFAVRNDCERVADSLNEAGISAVAYHAGLSDEQRTQCQEAWINNRYKVSQLNSVNQKSCTTCYLAWKSFVVVYSGNVF